MAEVGMDLSVFWYCKFDGEEWGQAFDLDFRYLDNPEYICNSIHTIMNSFKECCKENKGKKLTNFKISSEEHLNWAPYQYSEEDF